MRTKKHPYCLTQLKEKQRFDNWTQVSESQLGCTKLCRTGVLANIDSNPYLFALQMLVPAGDQMCTRKKHLKYWNMTHLKSTHVSPASSLSSDEFYTAQVSIQLNQADWMVQRVFSFQTHHNSCHKWDSALLPRNDYNHHLIFTQSLQASSQLIAAAPNLERSCG